MTRIKPVALLFLLMLTLACTSALAQVESVLLVNRDHPLPADYAPQNLVNLYEQKRHFRLARSNIFLERQVFEAANRMFAQAKKDGVERFTITSGYRSREKQEELYAGGANTNAAIPGTSEHETGLAFDVTTRRNSGGFETTKQFQWLIAHCWDYGFILRYPEGAEAITGFEYEPWHYRFVGEDIARLIRDRQWTLEEYCAWVEAQAAQGE